MNVIDTTQGVDPGSIQPFTRRSVKFIQDANKQMIKYICESLIGDGYLPNVPYALYGLGFAGTQSAPTSIASGYIYFNGELYLCGGNGSTPAGALFTITTTNDPVADPVSFTDNVPHNVHNVRTIVVSNSAASPAFPQFNLSSVIYIKPLPVNATIINSWTNFKTVQYFKSGVGYVYFDGIVTGGIGVPTSPVMFNLPAAYRPVTEKIITVNWQDSGTTPAYKAGIIRVKTTGDVEFLATGAVGTTSVYLAGVSFYQGW